jgi:hypothetical protein
MGQSQVKKKEENFFAKQSSNKFLSIDKLSIFIKLIDFNRKHIYL